MSGRYFEQLNPGDVIRHATTRTITEMDNVLFSSLTMNPQPMHIDEEYAKNSIYGTRIVNSCFTLGLLLAFSVPDLTLGTTIAVIAFENVVFPKPVFHGDTLRAESAVLEKRESKSRPDAGIVIFDHRAYNQRNELVASCRRVALMKKMPAPETVPA
ncbi:MAG: MaoC family dehydratase [Hyphomicrobiales bacterium]|nr:MaoC family dehydratase [Hyphomicrobiales bacterium]